MRRAAAVGLPLLAVLALVFRQAAGPAPVGANAPAAEFSSARAKLVLQELVAEGVPHPAGTPANARIRDRIVTRFRALGYDTTVQRRFACNAAPNCAMVENIIARAPGASRNVVLMAAHYDSVGAGPGASDDLMGTAALLEVARAMRGAKLRNPVTFLITDAEERGLLGAEAFVADEALVRGAAVVVNVENRGTQGTSNMFETSAGNRWLVRHLARSLPHPAATSFSATVYDLLPNDTDVTVFKRAGIAALNFASIGGPQRYHTPLDDFANASERTLQHHGENALSMARTLSDADLDARSDDDATFFDILGFTLLWWPAKTTPWLALLSLVALMIGARKTNARAMTFGVVATFTSMLLTILGAMGIAWIARLGSDGERWAAHPQFAIASMWLTAFAAALTGAAMFRKRSDARALLFGAAIVWHAVAIALALTLPGVSYLIIVPALAAAICGLSGANETAMSAIAATAGAIVLFPIGVILYDALGSAMLPAIAIFIIVIATLVAPLFARFRNALVAAIVAIVCAVIAALLPPITREHPQHVTLAYVDDGAVPPFWTTSHVTATLGAMRFARMSTQHTPWRVMGAWSSPAPRVELPRVTLRAERRGNTVIAHIASPRNATELGLIYRGATITRVNGQTPPPRSARFRRRDSEWKFCNVSGVTEATIEMTVAGAADLIATDVSHGLPPQGAKLIAARNATPAVPSGEGDITITRARTRIQ
jgi:Peptidase family M28